MFEIEVQHGHVESCALPPEVRDRFLAPKSITYLGHIKWEEHCTECAWPKCYTSCDLYSPRNDGNCRRTIDGFSPLRDIPVLGGYVVRVKFKRWANLTARCDLRLRSVDDVARVERRLNALSLMAARMPSLGTMIGRPGLPSRAVRRLKDRSVDTAPRPGDATEEPNCFVMDIYNPAAKTVALSLDISARGQPVGQVPFKRLLHIEPGFQSVRIPFDEIRQCLAGSVEVDVSVNPNILHAEEEGLTLYFGLMTFARDASFAPPKEVSLTKKIKVVVWDLDNTLWDGILIEDGPGKVTLRPGVREVILELDSRGIVNSIASKNNESEALAEIDRFGLRDYFVFPAIGWGPKSESVRRIRQLFNIGEDTVAFIDDQAFEREEVRAGNPQVRVYRNDEATQLILREEFNVPVTDEARNRRLFYQTEEMRQTAMQQSGDSYIEFLKQSNIRAVVAVASVEHADRIHELVQRTNQMNFSGNRYSKQHLLSVLSNGQDDCYLIDAEDNYGKYGYIGFAVVRRGPTPRVVDLAFSCRVQSKRLEHAVLIVLMERYAVLGASNFDVFYHATDKNAQIAQVFTDLDFREISRDGADFVYRRDVSTDIPKNHIVTVELNGSVSSSEYMSIT